MKDSEIFGKSTDGTPTNIRTSAGGDSLIAGDVASDSVDAGSPVKIGGQARTTNPTAVANGDRVNAIFDKLGRQLVIPYQVRDLLATASASLSTGTELTLLAGTAGEFHDLVQLSCSNSSDAAVTVSLRDATGGGVVKTILIPGNGQEHWQFTVPIPQNAAADTWTVDMSDITGTTVTIDSLFIKNA